MEQKDAYWEMQRKQLKEIEGQIEALQPGTQEEGEKRLRDKDLEALRAKMEQALKKADAAKGASEDAWGDLKAGVEAAVSDLKNAVKKAIAEFGSNKE